METFALKNPKTLSNLPPKKKSSKSLKRLLPRATTSTSMKIKSCLPENKKGVKRMSSAKHSKNQSLINDPKKQNTIPHSSSSQIMTES
jgi:hypothetical protein